MPLNHSEITRRREAKGLTKTDAAKLASISVQQWNDIESGRYPDIRLSTLEAMAKALKCKVQDLIK